MFEAPYDIEPLSELEEARNLLVKAISEKGPDYVYEKQGEGENCLYAVETPDGTLAPSCLVGHVLDYKGLLEEAHEHEHDTAARVAECLDTFDDPTTRKALDAAQNAQDGGQTWGEALEAFDKVVESRRAWING